MKTKRRVGERPAVTADKESEAVAENDSRSEVIVSAVEVSRSRVKTVTHHNRYRGTFKLFTPGDAAAMSLNGNTKHEPHLDARQVYVNTGIAGCVLLVVLGCVLYQYCRNRLRHDPHPRHHGPTRSAVEAVAAEGASPAQHPARVNDTTPETGHDRQSGTGDSTSHSELSQLTGSFGEGQPARYCFTTAAAAAVQVVPDSNSVLADADSVHNGVGSVTVKRKSATAVMDREPSLAKSSSERSDGTAKDQTSYHFGNATEDGDGDPGDVSSSQGRTHTDAHGERDFKDMPQKDAEAERHISKPSPQTDGNSDVSEVLASLGLEDLSSERCDVTEGGKNCHGTSRDTDDSVQSHESFSRLQNVKAQAEFSPYHIAWGTPSIPPHFFLQPQHPRSSSTAKKLNMDAVDRDTVSRTRAQREQPRSKTDGADVAQPNDGSTSGGPYVPRSKTDGADVPQPNDGSTSGGPYVPRSKTDGADVAQPNDGSTSGGPYVPRSKTDEADVAQPSEGSTSRDPCVPRSKTDEADVAQPCDGSTRGGPYVPRSKTDEADVAQPSEGSTSGGPCVPRGWGFLNPGDVSGRPISAAYRTPRASSKGRQGRSAGVVVGAEAEAQESQPLLAYTVVEYRKSLKDIALAASATFSAATYQSGSPAKTPRVSASRLSQSSCCDRVSLHGQSADSRVPLVSVGSSTVPEEGVTTGKTCRTHQFEGHLAPGSTPAGFGDVTQSSEAALSPDTEGRRHHMKNASEDVLNNNSNFVNCGESSNHSGEESSPLPSDISSPPPCTDSFDTDLLSSQATPSSESMGNTGDDMSPEVHTPSVGAEGRGKLSKQENTGNEQYVVSVWNRSSSPTGHNHPAPDNFKVPFPVDPVKFKCSAGISTHTSDTARVCLPRSKSSSHKPLAQHCLAEARLPQMRRSRTSESISSASQAQQQLMSVGSLTDVSVAGSSASRVSLAWDHEFTASGHSRCTNDSLTWEDDPYLQ